MLADNTDLPGRGGCRARALRRPVEAGHGPGRRRDRGLHRAGAGRPRRADASPCWCATRSGRPRRWRRCARAPVRARRRGRLAGGRRRSRRRRGVDDPGRRPRTPTLRARGAPGCRWSSRCVYDPWPTPLGRRGAGRTRCSSAGWTCSCTRPRCSSRSSPAWRRRWRRCARAASAPWPAEDLGIERRRPGPSLLVAALLCGAAGAAGAGAGRAACPEPEPDAGGDATDAPAPTSRRCRTPTSPRPGLAWTARWSAACRWRWSAGASAGLAAAVPGAAGPGRGRAGRRSTGAPGCCRHGRRAPPTLGRSWRWCWSAWRSTRDGDDLVRAALGAGRGRAAFFWLLWLVRSAGMGFGDVRLAALARARARLPGLGRARSSASTAGFLVFGVPGAGCWRSCGATGRCCARRSRSARSCWSARWSACSGGAGRCWGRSRRRVTAARRRAGVKDCAHAALAHRGRVPRPLPGRDPRGAARPTSG